MLQSATVPLNIQTTQGIIPAGVVSGNNWEMWVAPQLVSIAFKRVDWSKPVYIPISNLRSFVLE
jgi:hypothetical protein